MRLLIRFLLKFKTLFLFILLEVFSLVMIVNHNPFQRVHFLSSSNIIVGSLYSCTESISKYFSLGSVNRTLVEENADLKRRLNQLQDQVKFYQFDTTYTGRRSESVTKHYIFRTAKIIHASTNLKNNYLTLDKGPSDGIRDGLGVINEKGIVGIVSNATSHFSLVMPILNSFSKINAKVAGKSEMGTIIWDGSDTRYAQLEEVPLYIPISKGDTVVSNAYSSVFPEGIMIGTVSDMKSLNNNFYSIRVNLSVDFSRLSYVDVIEFRYNEERKELEREVRE